MRQRTCDPQILKTLTFRPFTENNFFNSCSVLSTENAWQMKSSGPSLLYHLDIRHLLKELDFLKQSLSTMGKRGPWGLIGKGNSWLLKSQVYLSCQAINID